MPAAAIFDLDRTLLRASSAPAINRALHAEGLMGRPQVPGQTLMLGVYELLGETLPSMALARAAVRACAGWPLDGVRRAAKRAAEELEAQVQPWAPELLSSHRRAGRRLVMATTTPYELVAPLAERLGFDDVVATRYEVTSDEGGQERFSGRLEGGFVWSVGKLKAVAAWARSAGVRLAESFAYTDSFFDLPLLMAVAHPVAVNPDPRLQAFATLRRWPVVHLDAPEGVPKLLGVEPLDLLRLIVTQVGFPLARFDLAGTEHVPKEGPAILAANHRSYFDPVAYAMVAFRAGRNPRGLAKKELFDAPLVGSLIRASGAICVDRKGSGRAAYEAAERALRAGELLLIAPQGTIPRGRDFFEPRLEGKSGAARLAAATGAPVIPVGVWGTEKVWPRSSLLPKPSAVLTRPVVRIRVGPAVSGLGGKDFAADTRRIMDAIAELLPAEARKRREPTAAELAATFPHGQAPRGSNLVG